MRTQFSYALSLFMLLGPTAKAESLTVRDLVEMAVSKSNELRAVQLEAESAQHSLEQASAWPNPSLELGTSNRQEREGDTHFTTIGISQAVENPYKLSAREKLFKAKAAMAVLDKNLSQLEFRARIINLIFEFQVAKEKASHAKERYDRFKTVGTFLRSRVFASPQKQAEASIVRAKIMVLSRGLRELEASRKVAWNNLNLFLKLGSEPSIKTEWIKNAPSLDYESLSRDLAKSNPEIQRSELRQRELESELALTRSERWPGLAISGTFENGHGANPEKIYGLGVSIPLPLLDTKSRSIESRQKQLQAQSERRKFANDSALSELNSLFEHYNSAKASISELSAAEIPKLEQEMESTDRGFKKGQVDLLTYIEADAEHFESLNAIFDSQIDFIDAQNSLFILVGRSPATLE